MCLTFASKEIRTEDYVNSDDDWVRPVISTLEQLIMRGALFMGVKISKNQIHLRKFPQPDIENFARKV